MSLPRLSTRARWLVAAVAAVGITLSLVVSLASAARHSAETERWLQERGEVVEASIAGTVKTATDGLSALAAFFENSDEVTESEFTGFVHSLDPQLWLLAVGYVEIVPAVELEAHEAALGALDESYRVTEFDGDGIEVPVERSRDVYYPITLLSPGPMLSEQLRASDPDMADVATIARGYDTGSPPEWGASMKFAISTDGPSVSQFLEIDFSGESFGQAFLVVEPVHDELGNVVGLVAAPMIDVTLTADADLSMIGGVDWALTNAGEAMPTTDGPVWDSTLELPGTVWELTVVPSAESRATLGGAPLWQSVAIGLVLTAMATYGSLLIAQRARAGKQVEEMERLAAEKDRFLASVSHELRTPLTVVSGLAHELVGRGDDFDLREASELLEVLAKQSDELGAIVEDLLVAARADIESLFVDAEYVDLGVETSRVLDAVDEPFEMYGEARGVWTDATRFRQIIRNLATNAVRYGGDVRQVHIGTDDDASWVEVTDSGPPIAQVTRVSMFEAYVTSSDQHGAQLGAMGLGLFISSRLAHLLGGDLTYRHDGVMGRFRLSLHAAGAIDERARRAA